MHRHHVLILSPGLGTRTAETRVDEEDDPIENDEIRRLLGDDSLDLAYECVYDPDEDDAIEGLERRLLAYYDEDQGSRKKTERNVYLPPVGEVVRGPIVIVAEDDNADNVGLLTIEISKIVSHLIPLWQSNNPETETTRRTDSMTTTARKPEAKDAEGKEIEFTNVRVMYVDDDTAPVIRLPEGMSLAKAREWLTKIEQEENRKFAFSYRFRKWYPFDAMWAVYRALAQKFGFVHVGDFQNWWGKTPPSTITIDTGPRPHEKQQIPWGPVEIHGLSAPLIPTIQFSDGLPSLELQAEVKNSERPVLDDLMRLSEELLRKSSVYRGRAVEVDFTIFTPNDIRFDVTRAPKFMDTDISESDLILPDSVHALMTTNLWTPLRHTAACRAHKIPLRRGVLLAGRYGVGKTLAAKVTAMECERAGWTFLYLRDLAQLDQALQFAKCYEPCVVFAEDVNRVVSGDRTAGMDRIFNILDGVDRKGDEVMVVFTTNDLDDIHEGMLRPGRVDTVITIHPPDARAAARLVRHYGRGIIAPDANLENVGAKLAGQIPAIIREAVERSKLSAIKDTPPGEPLVVRASHLNVAADEVLEHAKLLAPRPEAKPDLVVLGETIGQVIANGVRETFSDGSLDDDEAIASLPGALLEDAGRPSTNGHSVTE